MAEPAGEFTATELDTPASFQQVVEQFLGVEGDIPTLAKALKDGGHLTTLERVETLVSQQESGQDVGLRTDGYVNFFFVEKGAEKEADGDETQTSVSVVSVNRPARLWNARVNRLGNGLQWRGGRRFFFRNRPCDP